ncbi:MetQ/NlpA family ABC transporter substrate-binding protein [Natranaerobius trueperi]|uniref:Methionine ABC transporter substrate-binding protein n=1 Tax=Natranaerobius trueperi TaxID=759412 RepID=A0A226C237_9FIRM|nr:MetQ/NlpA family ABC transporter substrate-binding protein [Natranaerobius trueperi]OWZ84654.1 methionine ABC transporter substrate-binding protein [Natranaerobius trueperi]
MKKRLIILTILIVSISLVGCQNSDNEDTLEVIATPMPHAEILEEAKLLLEDKGINLEIVVVDDYVTPNNSLAQGEADANFFQHAPYFENFIEENDLDLRNEIVVHIEPMAIYSDKIDDLHQLEGDEEIAIPDDPTNGGRALLLLEDAGLLELEEGVETEATISDVVNSDFEITELNAAQIPRALDDVELALINTNYALEAGLSPAEDGLYVEDEDSPYGNIVAIREDEEDREDLQKLFSVLNSEEIRDFIEEEYERNVLPTF